MIGLLNLYRLTQESELLKFAEHMAETLIDRFFDGCKLIARLDESYRVMTSESVDGVIKWSTVPGSYHSKLSMGFLQLSSMTKDKLYKRVSDSICDYAISLQKTSGEFITNPDSTLTYLHPHLYSCEGLIYSGISQSNRDHYSAGLNGIIWAIKQAETSAGGGVNSNSGSDSVEQSDCTAQLLRLILICRSELEKSIDSSRLVRLVNRLHKRLLDFYVPTAENQGGMRYQLDLESICSWCTMFTVQAIYLWNLTNTKLKWLEFFV